MRRNKRILLIDDEPAFTRLVRINLENTHEYVAHEVNDPTRAVAEAKAFAPDAIVLDVSMPAMDGGDVLAALGADPALKRIPVIMLTALVGDEQTPAAGKMSGGRLFMPKPIGVAELAKAIERVCHGHGN